MKTLTARSMADALMLAQQEFGSDAVILHTRSFKQGGIFGIGAKQVVEVTAADGRAMGRNRKPSPRQELISRRRTNRPSSPAPSSPSAPLSPARETPPAGQASPQQMQGTAGDLIRRTYAAAKAELGQPAEAAQPAQAHAQRHEPVSDTTQTHMHTPSTSIMPPPQAASSDQLAREMRAMKLLVGRLMQQQPDNSGQSGPAVSGNLLEHYTALLGQQVSRELADEIIDTVRRKLTDDDLHNAEVCRRAVRKAIAAWLPVDQSGIDFADTGDDQSPRVVALVGPTGVGKTTTVAKLAATYKLKHNKQVGLITLDTYRIAAVEQLRTYAQIIGVPLHVAKNAQKLVEAIKQCSDCDLVLIDTAGRSQRDDRRLAELRELIKVAKPDQTHLVISSTASPSVIDEVIDRFSVIPTDRVLLTKLDEAVTCGVLLNVARQVGKKLSYITTGQEVPHQIEPGRSDRLADMVMGVDILGGEQ